MLSLLSCLGRGDRHSSRTVTKTQTKLPVLTATASLLPPHTVHALIFFTNKARSSTRYLLSSTLSDFENWINRGIIKLKLSVTCIPKISSKKFNVPYKINNLSILANCLRCHLFQAKLSLYGPNSSSGHTTFHACTFHVSSSDWQGRSIGALKVGKFVPDSGSSLTVYSWT